MKWKWVKMRILRQIKVNEEEKIGIMRIPYGPP